MNKESTSMRKTGELFVVSGPSGAGKGTILKQVKSKLPSLVPSVSATTRAPREGETDGVDYFFLDESTFEQKIAEAGFLEHAYVHGHYYGTPKQHVFDLLDQGKDVVLEIDVQGALQIKKALSFGTYIFIAPPSLSVLEKRLTDRGTETADQIALRMSHAKGEMTQAKQYDYIIFNDALDTAVEDFASIVAAVHLKASRQMVQLSSMFDE